MRPKNQRVGLERTWQTHSYDPQTMGEVVGIITGMPGAPVLL